MAFEEESKVACPKVVSQKAKKLMRKWLRHVEGLRDTKEVVYICDPEVGKTLSDEEGRSIEDLIDFQEGSDGNLNC
jgi:hypothetical protein